MYDKPLGAANKAWSDLEDNILDFLKFIFNVIALTVNIVFACYRRTQRRDQCDQEKQW